MLDSFGARSALRVNGKDYSYYRLQALDHGGTELSTMPYSLRVLLENLLRTEDGVSVTAAHVSGLACWAPGRSEEREIAFTPARVILQDFTGVPCVVDLASMRDAVAELGGDASRINPLQPVELVIDHSVQVDSFGSTDALARNVRTEFARNRERYEFLKWGQAAFRNLRVVPPSVGIVHQVNLEYLARVVFVGADSAGNALVYPDTVVGTDSHTTMVNGLGVLGWGVGGIEAEAAMLGQPISMLVPPVVGVRLCGELADGVTATDLVLTITEVLRRHGVVGKFVEFYGPGLPSLSLADRATIANMAPEYGATCGIFPVDDETLRYLRQSGRSDDEVALVEAYTKEQGLYVTSSSPEPRFTEYLSVDLSDIAACIAGPKRPQDRVPLARSKQAFAAALPSLVPPVPADGAAPGALAHGSVVIAAITSCTNTSNPNVMVAAGLLARNVVNRGLQSRPWVKTSLAPGSRVVTRYLDQAGLSPYLDTLGFHTVGYGCTTCIGNSGPLPESVSREIAERKLVVCSVLSGNRNFEGRVQQEVRANYLMSPPLVVAYAIAGTMDIDFAEEPLGVGADGAPVYLHDVWPSAREVSDVVSACVAASMYRENYAAAFDGDANWQSVACSPTDRYAWDPESTYIKRAPYFDGMPAEVPEEVSDIHGARVLAWLGDSVTTDHISPAGSIRPDSPGGKWLLGRGVAAEDFNSYGSRRGHDAVMVRGTFANVRIRNKLAPGTEGGVTTHLPTGEVLPIFDAAVRYRDEGTATVILAGKEYGSGSSRDWAAKGPYLQGVRVVLAESFERIHRSNLIGLGILPLQFLPGDTAESIGLTGEEYIDVMGLDAAIGGVFAGGRAIEVAATCGPGRAKMFRATIRIDTPKEREYYRHGGILQYVVRQLLAK